MEDPLNAAVAAQFAHTARTLQAMSEDAALHREMVRTAAAWSRALRAGGKILFAGNGGSAADAQHLAGELVSRFAYDRPGLAAFALTTDTSVLTAIGNDYGYERLFARQVEAVGRPGDVLVALSTSGRSANILQALHVARAGGLVTVGLTGSGGGAMPALCDHLLRTPAEETPRIQEGHIAIGHTLCRLVEQALFPQPDAAGAA
jgi:D-sedoheptulose 7-phosphate isomerase